VKMGKFVTFEGGEGAGKTSVVSLVFEYIKSLGHEVVVSREPGGIEIAEKIREVILDKNNIKMDGRTEALLYAASRRQHLVEKIVPSLENGKIILCDRFIDSSLAYQGYARGLGIDEVLKINQFAINGFMPDITFYLDISPEAGLARIRSDGKREINRLDMEAIHFHQNVREGYHKLLSIFPNRIIRIDAERSLNVIFEEIKQIINYKILTPLQE
jgi:dTMP kinase